MIFSRFAASFFIVGVIVWAFEGVFMKARLVAFALSLILFSCIALSAQVRPPEDYLGFRVGEDYKLADWQQITGYFNELGKSSDRIHVDVIGQTTLKKPFVRVTITSPENYAKIARYEEITRRLADPRGLSPEEADRLS